MQLTNKFFFQASELTTCQATLEKDRRDSRTALETESGSLRAQLQSHADSIKILVAEKADFEASLRKMNVERANKNGNAYHLCTVQWGSEYRPFEYQTF